MTSIAAEIQGWVALLTGARGEAAPLTGSDRDLVRRSRRGDRQAFAQLVSRYSDRTYSVARRLIADQGAAEDVTQEAFLRAYRGLADFDETRPLMPWLATIVRNLARNFLRKQPPVPVEVGPGAADPVSPATSPPEAAARSLRKELVLAEVARLPVRYREVVVLRYLQDRSVREVAALTDLPEGTVKTYLYRARDLLRRRLAPRLGDQ